MYGWEKYKSDKVIDYLISRIEACDEFPAVCVEKIEDDVYYLSRSMYNGLDTSNLNGGHHRAVAHYIANKPLKCIFIKKANRDIWRINIKDIIIHDDKSLDDCFLRLKKIDENYRK